MDFFFQKPKEEQKNYLERNFFNFFRIVGIALLLGVSACNNQVYIFNAQKRGETHFFNLNLQTLFFSAHNNIKKLKLDALKEKWPKRNENFCEISKTLTAPKAWPK